MSTQRPTQAELVEAIRVQYKVSLEEARRLFRESKRVEGKSKFKALAEPEQAESAPASRNPPRPTPDVTTHSQAIGVEGLSRRAPSLTPCGGSVARIGRSHAYNSGPNSCT